MTSRHMRWFYLQKRQVQSNSKSRSEKFNPHPEEVASGFPIDPPRLSQAAESGIDSQGHLHKRASHSGPLSQRAGWAKEGKRLDDASKSFAGADHQVVAGISTARRSLLSDDRRERSGPSRSEVPKLIGRFPGSFKEATESLIQQDQKNHIPGSRHKEDGRTSDKDPIIVSS